MNTASIIRPTVCIILLLILTVAGYDEEEKLYAELEISDLELQDDFDNWSNGIKTSILTNNLNERLNLQQTHGRLMKLQATNLKQYENIPIEVEQNWTVVTKPGDALLQDEDWTDLIDYSISNEELVNLENDCVNKTADCVITKYGNNNILENSRDKELQQRNWLTWQNRLQPREDQFLSILDLVNKAAVLNGKEDARSYWEMLEEQEDAYKKAEALWAEIQPLYLQLHKFVKKRIFNFYNITNDNSTNIPVHLLGSNFGDDWSYIADLVLPHPQLHYDIKTYVNSKSSKDIYKLGEELTQQLSMGSFGPQFWSNSLFNLTSCHNHIISCCSQGYSEIVTCNATSWVEYLNVFGRAINIALRNQDYYSLPRLQLRYSAIDEAIISLGEVLAINNLPFNRVLAKDVFEDESNTMTKLLLTALRILPKLPYYLAVDKWRIQELQSRSENVNEAWWKLREELQGVTCVSNNENYVADFLGDPFVISNKPYLHKFVGPILQFQILEYYKNSMSDPEGNVALEIGKDENFLMMIQNRPINNWPYLVNMYYGIYEVSASSLLEYFKPLVEYLDHAPLEQEDIITTERSIIRETTVPTTVTTPKNKKVKSLTKNNDTNKNDLDRTAANTNKNASSESVIMYIGIGLLVGTGVAVIISIVNKKVKKRQRINNRRFET